MMRRRLLLLAPLGLSACASLLPRQKYIPRTSWPLQPAPPPQAAAGPATGPVLLVRPISAAPGLEARGLQSLAADGSLQLDYYNQWAVPPADATTQALVSWAQASGLFSAVAVPGSRLDAGLILEGELTELLANPSRGEASATLTLAVIQPPSSATAKPVPLAQARLHATAPLRGTSPDDMQAAENAALASVLTQAMALLARFATPRT